jgi:hypothetical protein
VGRVGKYSRRAKGGGVGKEIIHKYIKKEKK